MKYSTRILIAVSITLLLAVLSINVWASPGRQGSVPLPPKAYPGRCSTDGTAINFGTGYAIIRGDDCIYNLKLIKDPTKKIAPALPDWSYFYIHAIDVRVNKGSVDSIEVCVPFVPNWADKVIEETINWYRWNAVAKEWNPIPTVITEEPPKMICGTSDQPEPGIFSLQGK